MVLLKQILSVDTTEAIAQMEVFCKKGVFRNFEKFTRKHLCQSVSFNKVADLSLGVLFFITEHLRWLLLILRLLFWLIHQKFTKFII